MKNWPQVLIAFIIVLGYVLAQAVVMTCALPPANHDLIQRTFGTLDTLVGTVVGFYFGASYVKSKEETVKPDPGVIIDPSKES